MNIIMTKLKIDFFQCTPIKTFCILNLNVFWFNWLIIQIYNFLFSCSNPDISTLKFAILFGKTCQESCYIMYWIYFKFVTEKSLSLVNHRIHHCLYTYTIHTPVVPLSHSLTITWLHYSQESKLNNLICHGHERLAGKMSLIISC